MMINSLSFFMIIFIFGLLVGSFLNVVIYRLPLMLESAWENEAKNILKLASEPNEQVFNLNRPNSHCPYCRHPLKFYNNIPLFSYLLQKGRCQFCKHKISWQYPLVELVTAIVFCGVYWRYGLDSQTAIWAVIGGLILVGILITLTGIDIKKQILPDTLTLFLLWLGLFLNAVGVYDITLQHAVFGAIAGYLLFWSIYQLFKLLTKKEGMGYGDFKLFAALGAWFGILNLPILLLLAALIGIFLAVVFRVKKGVPMPFGPALAISGVLFFIFGPQFQNLLLNLMMS